MSTLHQSIWKTLFRIFVCLALTGAAIATGILCAIVLNAPGEEQPLQTLPTIPATQTQPQTLPTQTEPTQPQDISADWSWILVNPWHSLPEDFAVELVWLDEYHQVDIRIVEDLQAMLADANACGLYPLICSAYRSQETQQQLHANRIRRCLDEGLSQEEAEAEAGRWVAVPGTSEHQTGLALDIVCADYPYLDWEQENTAEQKWLMENSWHYGFILRYPTNKVEVTGIYYEPWHYRYVGRETAAEIYRLGCCFEEYLEMRGISALE